MPEIEEFLTVSDEQQVKNVLDQIEQKIRHQLEFTQGRLDANLEILNAWVAPTNYRVTDSNGKRLRVD